MAKAYILNIKDTSGNWVGIPTLIGQKGEKGLNGAKGVDGVGITNITQQDKKLIIDLSNNTRKEFTIPSADLPNGSVIVNRIISDTDKKILSDSEYNTRWQEQFNSTIIVLTLSEYNALATKDPNKIYLIKKV